MPSVDEPSTSPDSSATGCLSNTSGGSNVLLRLPEPLAEQPTGHYCRHRPYSHDWPFLYLERRTISNGGESHSSAQTPIQRVEQGIEARGDAHREAESADPFQLDEAV